MTHRISILLLTVAFAFSSCESFVEPGVPKTEIPLELAFSDDKTATASVVGIYARMNNLNYQFANVLSLILPGMMADEMAYAFAFATYDEFKNNNVLSSNQYLDAFCTSLYQYIYYSHPCFVFLENS